MSDQVLVAVISALGSALVAYITAHENRKKNESKEKELSELEKLKEENAQLRKKLERKSKDENSE
ncbi:cell division protein FtsL [Ligilactobacillus murinus]|uniref:cell division protein FtsL n=1 Tax=Ligilactobacillus murinus TaxID=1622 RepID=UPI00296B1638|nr:cell division protein FtsL [Ligilactobacillus murinus]WOY88199.1 cell division protein FtsL [Ligilactobacillus murinus]